MVCAQLSRRWTSVPAKRPTLTANWSRFPQVAIHFSFLGTAGKKGLSPTRPIQGLESAWRAWQTPQARAWPPATWRWIPTAMRALTGAAQRYRGAGTMHKRCTKLFHDAHARSLAQRCIADERGADDDFDEAQRGPEEESRCARAPSAGTCFAACCVGPCGPPASPILTAQISTAAGHIAS